MFIVESYGSVVLGHDVMLGIMGKYSKIVSPNMAL